MQLAYEEFRKKIVNLQSDVSLFQAEFLDRDEFKRFADSLARAQPVVFRLRRSDTIIGTWRLGLDS
jgi:hypothetical protein